MGSALTKHPVASQIWTHNNKRLAYTLTAKKMVEKKPRWILRRVIASKQKYHFTPSFYCHESLHAQEWTWYGFQTMKTMTFFQWQSNKQN